MAYNPKFGNAFVNAEAVGGLQAVFASGKLRIYDGTQPTDADTALGGGNHLLAELTFGSPAFPAAVAGLITMNAITKDSDADATGTAAFFRCTESDGTTGLMDGTVGTTGCDLNLDSVAIQQHADVSVTSFTIQLSKG